MVVTVLTVFFIKRKMKTDLTTTPILENRTTTIHGTRTTVTPTDAMATDVTTATTITTIIMTTTEEEGIIL